MTTRDFYIAVAFDKSNCPSARPWLGTEPPEQSAATYLKGIECLGPYTQAQWIKVRFPVPSEPVPDPVATAIVTLPK